MVESLHQQDDLLGISWLWFLVNYFECCEGKSLDKEVLIDQVPPYFDIEVFLIPGSLLVETTQSLEEPHDLGFA